MEALTYVETGTTDVALNFGTEYYFATEKHLDQPVFLLWSTSPTLMLGKYQNIYEEINLGYARSHHIQLVRRYSGGGTIYTDEGGFQFSFILPQRDQTISFQEYLKPILRALREIGIPAEFNGRNDLTVEGKKFSGNAQYHQKGFTIHHGSLLFDTNIAEMVASTNPDPYKIESHSIKSVHDRVTNLRSHLKEDMDAATFQKAILRSVLREGSEYHLTPEDEARIGELAEERFRSWESIYGASPAFSLKREKHWKGGRLRASMNVEKGRLSSVDFSGDFFSAVELEPLEEALIGCPFEKEAILEILRSYEEKKGSLLYGISPEEIAETMVAS